MLKGVEFGAESGDVSVAQLTMVKNKKLESELAQLRHLHAESEQAKGDLSAQLSQLQSEQVRLNELTAKLEADLQATKSEGNNELIMTIVTAQRDRFRERVTQVE